MKSLLRKGALLLSVFIIYLYGYGQTHSQLASHQCGEVVPLNTYNGGFVFDEVPQAEDYRMTVLNIGGSFYYKSITSGGPNHIPMSAFTGMEPDRNYRVVIQVKTNGSWGGFGPTCNISTIEYEPSLLIPTQCGEALNLEGSFVFVEVEEATNYRMTVQNYMGGPFYFESIESGGPRFISRSEFTGLQFGYNYIVVVQVKIGNVWHPFGPSCLITVHEFGLREGRTSNFIVPKPEMSIYPNPSNGAGFTINIKNLKENANPTYIYVYDIHGKQIYSEEVTHKDTDFNTRINRDGSLACGIYTVKLVVGADAYSERVVIQ